MINRLLLRNKVVQTLYSTISSDTADNLVLAENELLFSIEKSNLLYHSLFKLVDDVTRYAEQRIEDRRNKILATYADKNPNLRFVNNRFALQVRGNVFVNGYLQKFLFDWGEYPDVVKELWREIEGSALYDEYMMSEEDGYEADRAFWVKVFKKIVPRMEELHSAIEESSIYWVNDLDVEISFVLKTMKLFAEENGDGQQLLLHSSEMGDVADVDEYVYKKNVAQGEDVEYAKRLLDLVLVKGGELEEMIEGVTINWKKERLVMMDTIILKAALVEVLYFPLIPVNVTLNEYINLSKEYSTKKSSLFVNGVLDRLVANLKAENKIQKMAL